MYIGVGWRSAWRRYVVVIFLAASSALVSGCAQQEAARPSRPAVPVIASYVTRKSVPIEVSAIGNVEAYSTVSIKAQVSGELLEVHFKEGDSVRKGQLLLTIDPRPYQAALAQA